MRKQTIILLVIFLAIIIAAIYGWNEYHRTNTSVAKQKPDFTVTAAGLIGEFEKSDTLAEKKYLGKLVEVNGMIKQVEKDRSSDYTVVLGESGIMSGIRCSMDTTIRAQVAQLKEGTNVVIKGMFTGYQKDETGLLGSDIILNRAIIANTNQ